MSIVKVIGCVLVYVIWSIDVFGQDSVDTTFDQCKWLISSEYRYKASSEVSFEEMVKDKSIDDVIKVLGEPDVFEDSVLVYCFGIPKRDKKATCKGSRMVIDFKIAYPYRVTNILVEPGVNKNIYTLLSIDTTFDEDFIFRFNNNNDTIVVLSKIKTEPLAGCWKPLSIGTSYILTLSYTAYTVNGISIPTGGRGFCLIDEENNSVRELIKAGDSFYKAKEINGCLYKE